MKIFTAIFLTLLFAFSVSAQKQAQVIVTSTFLRKSPDSSSEKVQTVQKGEKLSLEKNQETKGWYYVSVVSNGSVKGWIRKDTISQPFAGIAFQKPKKAVSVPSVAGKIPTANKPANVNTTLAATRTPSSAAKPPPVEDEEIIRVITEEVSLNVRVVDADNRAVRNLNQSQFRIYEDDVLQPITSLVTAEIPMINALVIDNSRSLRLQLKNIIEAGKIIVGTNRAADESSVIRFVGADKIEVVQDFTTKKNALFDGLNNLFVEGGQTAIVDAVYLAAKKIEQYQKSTQKDDVKLRALILVSDGDDRASTRGEEQLFKLLRESQVQIYAVGFVNNLSGEPDAENVNRRAKAKALLTWLATQTGGKVYFPASIDELPAIAADISGELHTQYLISYTPTNETRDGTFRKIKVSVAEGANWEKRIAVTRAGRISAAK